MSTAATQTRRWHVYREISKLDRETIGSTVTRNEARRLREDYLRRTRSFVTVRIIDLDTGQHVR